MPAKRSGLGRNLSALLGDTSFLTASNTTSPSGNTLLTVPIETLKAGVYQPRTVMDEENLASLAESIKQQGLLQPILVRKHGASYEIIAGERRWRASQIAGLTEIPILIRDVDNETAMAMGLIENLQREDLNPIDEARAMARLHQEFSLTHQQIADLLVKSRASVTNFLRLLSLPPEVMTLVEHGDLDMGHARALLLLEPAYQTVLAHEIIAKNLSVRETERRVNQLKNPTPKSAAIPLDESLRDDLKALNAALKTKIGIKPGKKAGQGTLVIKYKSAEALRMMMDSLRPQK